MRVPRVCCRSESDVTRQPPVRASWPLRTFRALLTLYPHDFRDEYGRELALFFADRYRDAETFRARALLWFDALRGVIAHAPREHLAMLRQDLRYAVRALGRTPLFTATVIVTLALGIGANTGVFQLIEAVGLRTLPVRNPHELAEVRIVGGNGGFGINPGSYGQLTQPIWHELRVRQQAFSRLFAWGTATLRVGENHDLRRTAGLYVSGEFFDTLGVPAAQGRLLGPTDEAAACPAASVVLSHGYWLRELGGRPLGPNARIRVDGEWRSIVGVTQAGFSGLAVGESFDVALPICKRTTYRRELFDTAVMGRLRPDWTLDRALAHVDALSAGLFADTAPAGYGEKGLARFKAFRLGVFPAAAGVSALRAQYDRSLWLLLAISGLVLLIACANLANLMLARASFREREMAVRQALGASRFALVRQLVTESALLAVVGAALGVVLAQGMSRVLVWALSTQSSAPMLTLTANLRVLAFTALVASVTCIVFGVTPAVRATRIAAASAMGAGRGLTADRRRLVLQRGLVALQIAVSLVLLVGAALFVGSFRNLMQFDPGMRQDGITVAFLGYPRTTIPPERLNEHQRALVDEVRALPGVINAATTTNAPLMGSSWGHGITVDTVGGSAKFTWVGPGYFETMGIPIRRGRDVAASDTPSSARVAIVNEAFVRQFIPSGGAIGRVLRTEPEPGYPSTMYEIVGVIPDTRYSDYREAPPSMVFAPDSQFPRLNKWATVVIHATSDTASLTAALKQRMAQGHPDVIMETMPFAATIRDGLVRERLLALLSGLFGVLAAVLAVVGLYGMMSFATAQRRQEIGVRMALGANAGDVVGMVMREAGRLVAVGLTVGAVAALIATNSASTLLFGLTPRDPLALAGAAMLLAAIAGLAAFVPARRAARIDPIGALRQE
jgi:predicted permease